MTPSDLIASGIVTDRGLEIPSAAFVALCEETLRTRTAADGPIAPV